MIKQPMLNKVFLALRTNFIPELTTEHITLAYFKEIRWDALLDISEKYDTMTPATIHIGKKIVWESEGKDYYGFGASCHDSNILRHLLMPHITVPKHMLDVIYPLDLDPVQVMDRIWVGKKIDGHLIWATVSSTQMGPGDAALNWDSIDNRNVGDEWWL